MMTVQLLLGASAHAVEQKVKAKKIFNEILAIATWLMGKPFLSLTVKNVVVLVAKQGSHAKNKYCRCAMGLVYLAIARKTVLFYIKFPINSMSSLNFKVGALQ